MLFKKDKLRELSNVELNHAKITKIQLQIYVSNIKRFVFQMVTIVSWKINVKHIKVKLPVILVD